MTTDVRAKLIAAGILKVDGTNGRKPVVANQDAVRLRRMENKGLKMKAEKALNILESAHADVH